jgi:hypothetical protein
MAGTVFLECGIEPLRWHVDRTAGSGVFRTLRAPTCTGR